MQVVLSEAQESYKDDIIMVLSNDNVEQQEANTERIVEWLNNWVVSTRNESARALRATRR